MSPFLKLTPGLKSPTLKGLLSSWSVKSSLRHPADAIDKINVLRKQSPSDKARGDCHEYYVAVIRDDVPQAGEAIDEGDTGKAEQRMYDAAGNADSCEKGFKRGSHLTSSNNAVKDVSLVAAATVRSI